MWPADESRLRGMQRLDDFGDFMVQFSARYLTPLPFTMGERSSYWDETVLRLSRTALYAAAPSPTRSTLAISD
jgi:hypothetical protein